jgi:disulfide oxidoreductase YuzD
MPNKKIKWRKEPEKHDYPAAESYLSLIYPKDKVEELIGDLKSAPITHFKAKDIFRASSLSLLGISNSHVEKDIKKIQKNKSLSPILLVRDDMTVKVVVADGYHRLCAVYRHDEDALIPCKIA